jgi:hypothetical protein
MLEDRDKALTITQNHFRIIEKLISFIIFFILGAFAKQSHPTDHFQLKVKYSILLSLPLGADA